MKRYQIKSKWYYIFWGVATVSVVTGQILVAQGYHRMSVSVEKLTTILHYRMVN